MVLPKRMIKSGSRQILSSKRITDTIGFGSFEELILSLILLKMVPLAFEF